MTYRFFEYFIDSYLDLRNKKDLFFLPLLQKIPTWMNPNILTASRAVIVILLFVLTSNIYSNYENVLFDFHVALIIILYIAGLLSDLIDGALARFNENESKFGGYFDSIVDKVFIIPFIILLYKLYPFLYLSLVFFFGLKIVLILFLLLMFMFHKKSLIVNLLRNYYARVYTAGYFLFFYFLFDDIVRS